MGLIYYNYIYNYIHNYMFNTPQFPILLLILAIFILFSAYIMFSSFIREQQKNKLQSTKSKYHNNSR